MAGLRARIRRIEGSAAAGGTAVPLGIAALDTHLPGGGLARGALHEIAAESPGDAGAGVGFCAVLLARLLRGQGGPVLWCQKRAALDAGEIYPPGLTRFGLDPARLIAVHARRDKDVLWTLEEGLASAATVAVLGEIGALDLTASRRLQLAAERARTPAILLRLAARAGDNSAAATRWRIAAMPSRPRGYAAALNEPGEPCWRARLMRCRGGTPGSWIMEWRDETGDLTLAAPVRDRPAQPCRAATR
jgi:protein ImuA